MTKFIISAEPANEADSEKAIPVQVFNLDDKEKFIKSWVYKNMAENIGKKLLERSFELKNIIDWNYYDKRIKPMVLKLVSIPAVFQGLPNPIP